MPLIYVDTSALAKWYLPEADSEKFAAGCKAKPKPASVV